MPDGLLPRDKLRLFCAARRDRVPFNVRLTPRDLMAIRFQRRARVFRLFIRADDIVPLTRQVLNQERIFGRKKKRIRSAGIQRIPAYSTICPPGEIVFHKLNG